MTTNEIRSQLEECFAVVFPDLTPDEIPSAAMTTVDAWDSLGSLTLVSVVEEMFGFQFEINDLPELVSFELIAKYLQARCLKAA
jgi:acyl carrier protein